MCNHKGDATFVVKRRHGVVKSWLGGMAMSFAAAAALRRLRQR